MVEAPAAVALRLVPSEAELAALAEPLTAVFAELQVVKAAALSVAIRFALAAALSGERYLTSADPLTAALVALQAAEAVPLSAAIQFVAAAVFPGERYLTAAEPWTAALVALRVVKAVPPSDAIRFAAAAALSVGRHWALALAPAARDLRVRSHVHSHLAEWSMGEPDRCSPLPDRAQLVADVERALTRVQPLALLGVRRLSGTPHSRGMPHFRAAAAEVRPEPGSPEPAAGFR